ncbi:DNA-directed DNA polymerase [Tanacetum coccineum]
MNERCSSKEKDPGSFTIPCDIGQLHINNALADLGASISLMPYTMYKKLGLGEPKATRMSLELADRSIQYPRGIIENVLIKVDKFVLPIDFVILDMLEDSRVPIILGRPFLATARAMIDVFNKKITLRVWDDEVIFNIEKSIKRLTTKDDECYGIDDLEETINEEAQELLANEEPDSFLSRGMEKSIDQSDLESCESASSDEKNGSDSENSIRHIDSANTPYPVTQGTTNDNDVKSEHLYSASANEIDEKKPKLKNLTQHLEYAYLHGDKSFPIIISSELSEKEKISLLQAVHGILPNTNRSRRSRKDYLTCPYRTFAYLRMPFGLCNAPATFQRCMMAILHDMVEEFMKVFMDDFSVFVKEGIVLGHKISGAGIEVDRAKINVIAKLPYPTNVKGVRRFLDFTEGAENLATDHLSRLENPNLGTFTEEEITDEFPDEHLMILKAELNNDEPWYADYDEAYAFKLCSDNVMRRCVAGNEILEILVHCHSGPTGGHHSCSQITGRKLGKFTFPVDFIILDMPEDIKVPLILKRPFLSIACAKIDIYKRKITLRVGEEKIIFTSVKPASILIKRVYMLSLRERMELDLEARLMGERLVLNRSLDTFLEDYIELNDLNEPFELRRNQGDVLMPTIKEGEVIEEFRTRYEDLDTGINDYPSYCNNDKKIHIDCAPQLKVFMHDMI